MTETEEKVQKLLDMGPLPKFCEIEELEAKEAPESLAGFLD